MAIIIANSADPDEMPRCADPDEISRHCLQMIHLQDTLLHANNRCADHPAHPCSVEALGGF